MNDFLTFIDTNKNLILSLTTICTLIFTIYSTCNNKYQSRKSEIFRNTNLLLTTLYSPLYTNRDIIKLIFSDNKIKDFYVYNSFLIENDILLLLNEIYKTENILKHSNNKLLLTKHTLSKKYLFELVEKRYLYFKKIFRYERFHINILFNLSSGLKFLFFFCLITLCTFLFFVLLNFLGFLNFFSTVVLFSFVIFFSIILAMFFISPSYKHTYKSFFYFKGQLSPYDSKFSCFKCNCKFNAFKNLPLNCPCCNSRLSIYLKSTDISLY